MSGRLAKKDGKPWTGKLGVELTTEQGKQAARGIAIELLATLQAALGDLDKIKRIVKLLVLVNSAPHFTEPHVVANGASELFLEIFGELGAHARSAFGAAQIPFGCCVEIDLIAEVTDRGPILSDSKCRVRKDKDNMRESSQVPIWFERKFDVSFPVALLPNLCARLRGTPARLEEAVRGRSHKLLTGKAREKWSAQEHAGHLLDLEPLWLARVGDYVAASDQLTVADLKNRQTDEAKHNTRPLEQILSEFRAAREGLLKCVDELDGSLFDRAIPHPRLKTPMRLVDHLYFVAEHDDHHLARIWELVNNVR